MNDRFKFRIPMFTDKGSFMEFQYVELGDFIECTLCGTNDEPQQCTGLKDKNGKLIYEGDKVIYYHEKKHLVPVTDKKPFEAPYGMDEESGLPLAYRTKKIIRYKGVVSVCPLTGVDINLGNRCHWWSGITKDNVLPKVEVIGNIYENSELLEVSNDH